MREIDGARKFWVPVGIPRRARRLDCLQRILIIDDDTEVADTCARVLKTAKFDCLVAYDSPMAILLFDSSRPALVLSDINLPTGNGYEIARYVREEIAWNAGGTNDYLSSRRCSATSFWRGRGRLSAQALCQCRTDFHRQVLAWDRLEQQFQAWDSKLETKFFSSSQIKGMDDVAASAMIHCVIASAPSESRKRWRSSTADEN